MEENKPRTPGKRNRAAGHNWEREVVLLLKAIGFINVATSRSQSRARDDKKIDIMNSDEDSHGRLPYNIQCKSESKSVAYPKILSQIPKDGRINVVFHKQTKRSGTKFLTQDMYAVLYLQDFLNMMSDTQLAIKRGEIIGIMREELTKEQVSSINKKLKKLGYDEL